MPSHYNKMNQMSTNQRRTTNRVRRARNNTSAMGVSSNMVNKPTFGNMIPVGQIKRMSGLPDDQVMFPYCLAQILYSDNPDPCCFDSSGNHFYQRRFEGPQTQMCMNGQQPNEAGGKLIKGMTNMISLSELKGMVGGDDQIMMPYCGNDYNMENDPCCEEPAGQYWGTRRFSASTLCMNGQYPMEAGGSVKRTRAMGGSMGSSNPCPPGMHMMPDGSCMEGEYHGAPNGNGYRRGGRTRPRPKPARRRFNTGGHTHIIPGSLGYTGPSAGGPGHTHFTAPISQSLGIHQHPQSLPPRPGRRLARGGRARKRFNTGGTMHYGGNTACKMITSKYDCVAPCTWDFNDGDCH